MIYSAIKIDPLVLGREIAEALNDVGLGRHKDSDWFIEEIFCRLKKYHYGYKESLDEAEKETKTLLEIHDSVQKANEK